MNPRSRQNLGVGASESRSPFIVALLVFALGLVVALSWQAHGAASSHQRAAEDALRDYARLASEEFLRRARIEAGYNGYYTLITALSATPDADLERLTESGEDSVKRAAELAAYAFSYDPGSREYLRPPPDAAVATWLAARFEQAQHGGEGAYGTAHALLDGRARSFVYTLPTERGESDPSAPALVGFEVAGSVLGARFREILDQGPLLPAALATHAVGNESLYLRVADSADGTLYTSGNRYDPYLLVDQTLGADYAGIFEGYRLQAAIDPAVASLLVIGGLPSSRLPLTLALLLLTVGLLVAAIRQLQRERTLMALRADFVSRVSHELRTPLTQIRMFAETLLYRRARSGEDRQRALEIIDREAQRLTHLVENVLQFSSSQRGETPLHPQRQRLAPIVEEVVQTFRPLSGGSRIELQVRTARTEAVIDGDALRQILLNMLDNAVKYGPATQTVHVELDRHGGSLHLSVCDQGPGIPEHERKRIWQGYYRLERERTSAVAGTGIGLAVVRDLAERHGATTWVEAGDAGGARFVIAIPAADTAPQPVSQQLRSDDTAEAPR